MAEGRHRIPIRMSYQRSQHWTGAGVRLLNPFVIRTAVGRPKESGKICIVENVLFKAEIRCRQTDFFMSSFLDFKVIPVPIDKASHTFADRSARLVAYCLNQ